MPVHATRSAGEKEKKKVEERFPRPREMGLDATDTRVESRGSNGLTSGPELRPCQSPSPVRASAVRVPLSAGRQTRRARIGSKRRWRSRSKRWAKTAGLLTSVLAYDASCPRYYGGWRLKESQTRKSRSGRRARESSQDRPQSPSPSQASKMDNDLHMYAKRKWPKTPAGRAGTSSRARS